MALMNSIMGFNGMPMTFVQPLSPPALSGNPELAKAAMYGGGGQQPAVSGGQPPAAGGVAPDGSGGGGILGSISKVLGGAKSGGGNDFLMQLLASLG